MIKKEKKKIGWREYLRLVDFKNSKIKVKVDTGARTSALHITDLEIKKTGSVTKAYFNIHPRQKETLPIVKASAKVIEFRNVKSSNGVTTKRPVILTPIKLGEDIFEIELTLVNRDMMGFRMLLGREAVKKKYLVDPGSSYLMDKKTIKK